MSREEMAAVLEKLREFDRVADLLDMPRAERLGILNISDDAYVTLRNGRTPPPIELRPELERRLSYALPLMRRLASNTPANPAASAPKTTQKVC